MRATIELLKILVYKRYHLFVIASLCIPNVAGCGMVMLKAYEGPECPREQIAVILTERLERLGGGLYITDLDGRKVQIRPRGTLYGGAIMHESAAVKPGEHTLKLRYDGGEMEARNIALKAHTEAGHTYLIRFETSCDGSMWGKFRSRKTRGEVKLPKYVRVWVEETASGEKISETTVELLFESPPPPIIIYH